MSENEVTFLALINIDLTLFSGDRSKYNIHLF